MKIEASKKKGLRSHEQIIIQKLGIRSNAQIFNESFR